MFKKFTCPAILFILLPLQIFSLPEDEQQPIQIQSEQVEYNVKAKLGSYRHHVVAIQGSRKLEAEELKIWQDGQNQIEKIVATGSPAKFSTYPNAKQKLLHAEALRIEYNAKTKLLRLIQNAHLDQDQNIINAPEIDYDLNKEIAFTPKNAKQRTVILLSPKNKLLNHESH